MNTVPKIDPKQATPVTTPDIHARMVAVMRDLGAIGKDKKNEAQGFKYRGIDDVYNAINPILAQHGVFMTASVIGKSREERTNAKGTVLAFTCLHMRYSFIAEDGSHIETEAEGEGMDSGDKSSNKAMAVAHKYALLQTFCIPTQDLVDPDAETHEVKAAPSQRDAIHTPKTMPVDQDIVDGVANWIEKQKGILLACNSLSEILQWQDEQEDALNRLLKKYPNGHAAIMAAFHARSKAINQQETI